jgi:hypothetical protein
MRPLDPASRAALEAKRALRVQAIQRGAAALALAGVTLETPGWLGRSYGDTPVGRFENLESNRLAWREPDWFELIPKRSAFRFVRASGETIEPRRMFTDGGSIPRVLWPIRSLSPWGYAPAFLVHDWEFDRHHCRHSAKTFEAVRDTMMEAVKTLMETGVCPLDRITFRAIQGGIDSPVARIVWDLDAPECPIPPDLEE